MLQNIEGILRRLKIPDVIFCALSGVSTAQWSRILHGTVQIDGAESLRLQDLATELSELAAAAEPFALSFKDASVIKKLLEDRRNGIVWNAGLDVDAFSNEVELTE